MNSLQILILLISALFLIAGIFWGIKRYRRLKYERIKTRLRYKNSENGEDYEEEFGSELPGGGARVVAHRDPDDIETVNSRIREQAEANKPKLSISVKSLSEQGSLDLGLEDTTDNDPHIPVLLDPTDELDSQDNGVVEDKIEVDAETEIESSITNESGLPAKTEHFEAVESTDVGIETFSEVEEVPEQQEETFENPEVELAAEAQAQAATQIETAAQAQEEKPDHSILFSAPETTEKSPSDYAPASVKEQESSAEFEAIAESISESDSEPKTKASQEETIAADEVELSEPSDLEESEAEAKESVEDEVIIVNLMCTDQGEEFQGTELTAALTAQGLIHGNMDIFHYDSGTGDDTLKFSVANILNPGTFPREKLEYFYTPGICFFMTLTPGVSNLQTFNHLLSAARGVASRLGGELKDQNREYLTHQKIEQIRTRMGEFQRENLLG